MITDADAILRETRHRPWPVSDAGWVLAQDWNDLLLAHWRVPVEAVRGRVPAALDVETFDGSAWVAVTPFRMTGFRPRFIPPIPVISEFREVNVRTYVRHGERPGIWFLSLDCDNPLASAAARTVYHLPYFDAQMESRPDGGGVRFRSRRTDLDAPAAAFTGRYEPIGPGAEAAPSSFEAWAAERYCLYSVRDEDRSLWRTEIHHRPWVLRPAAAEVPENSMVSAAGIRAPEVPEHLHFSSRLEVLTWLPVQVGRADDAIPPG